jgi:hypothetical protein
MDHPSASPIATCLRAVVGPLACLLVVYPGAQLGAQAAASPIIRQPTGPGSSAKVVAHRTSETVRVDASLDEPMWSAAQAFELPFETYPGNNTAAAVRTECRIAYDAANLYLGCRAFDPAAGAIRAVRADRDAILEHDRVGVTIDPFSDRRRGWQFAINPLGVQYDAVYDASADMPDDAWNAIWSSAGRIVADGYVVEAAIPFKSLRFPASASPREWGLLAWRHRPREANVVMQSVRIDQAVRCLLCQAGTLTGLVVPSPSRNIELGPTLTTIRTDRRASPDGPMDRGAFHPEVGLDARWSITPDVTLNATANPDFSQVEADAAQIEANNLFALSYPERRPFFLDGADLFASPNAVVFTRTIADPASGARLTAKHRGTAVALLGARDAVTNVLIAGRERSPQLQLDRPSTAIMARVRRDLMGASTIGLLGTHRSSDGYANRVIAIDALLRPHATTSLSAQAIVSATRYPDSLATRQQQSLGEFTGSLVGARAFYQTRDANMEASLWKRTLGLRADLGFIPQVGVVEAEIQGDRVFWGTPGSWLTRLALGAGYFPTKHDTTHAFVNAWRFVRIAYEGPAGLSYRAYLRMRTETFGGVRYDYWTPWMALQVEPSKALRASVDATFGGEIDYDGARLARTIRLTPAVTLRVTRNAEVRLRQSNLTLRTGEEALLRATASEVRAAYHPTSRTFVRALVQYRTTRRTGASLPEVSPSRRRSLTSQLLLSYRVDAQTAALVGYGDTRQAAIGSPEATVTAEASDELRPMARSFFVKLSYAYRP